MLAWSVLKIPEFMGLDWVEVAGSLLLVLGLGAAGVRLWRQASPAAQIGEHGQHAATVGVGVEQA